MNLSDQGEISLRRGSLLPAVVAMFGSLLVVVLVVASSGGVGSVVDTDGFMRLVRIDELRSGVAGWFDGVAMRSNAPYGHSMHWTRPLDLLVLMLALVVGPFAGSGSALESAAMVVAPLTLVVTSGVVAWAGLPLVGRVGSVVAGLGVALQPALFTYGSAGRVDHHGLIFLLTAWLTGVGIRIAVDPDDSRHPVTAGVVAALGLWVSTEFLLPIGIFLALMLVGWVMDRRPDTSQMVVFSVSWTVGVLGALVLERAPDMVVSRDLDRISAVHLVVAAASALFWFLIRGVPSASRLATRAVSAVVAGAVSGVVVWLLVPSFAAGPFGDVPPALWDGWLSRVAELQPLWPLGSRPERTLYLLAAPLLAIVVALWAARRGRQRGIWLSIGFAVVVFALIGLVQARFTAFAQLTATLPLGWLSAHLVERIGDRTRVVDSLRRVGAMALGAAGFVVPVLLLAIVQAETAPGASAIPPCPLPTLIDYVGTRDSPVVLAHVDWGPEILYRTDASVVAAPYHRNVDGILDQRRFLTSPPAVARAIALERGVDVVAVCLQRDGGYVADDRTAGDLLGVVADDRAPSWLTEEVRNGDLRVYRVVAGATP